MLLNDRWRAEVFLADRAALPSKAGFDCSPNPIVPESNLTSISRRCVGAPYLKEKEAIEA